MRERKSRRAGQGHDGNARSYPKSTTNGRSLSNRDVPIYVGQKVIGYVAGGVFRKSIRGSVHMLRRPRAIAFDVSTLHDAEAAGARRVEVADTDTGRVYQLPISTVWAKGFEFNRGFGDQWGVILAEWLRPGEVETRQPSLFEGAL